MFKQNITATHWLTVPHNLNMLNFNPKLRRQWEIILMQNLVTFPRL